jgi:hypothetical protein
MAHIIKLVGSEERATAMLAAGTVRLLDRSEPRARRRAEALRRLRPFHWEKPPAKRLTTAVGPLQAPWRHEYWSQDRTGKARLREAMKQRWLNECD